MKIVNQMLGQLSRVRARCIRTILHLQGVNLDMCESLRFGENEGQVQYSILSKYSEGSYKQFFHPRESAIESFAYQERYLFKLDSVCVDTLTGIMFTNSGKILEESSAWSKEKLLINSIPKPIKLLTSLNHVTGNSIILPSNGYYHWLIEDLPGFLWTLSNTNVDEILVYSEAPNYVKSILNLLPGNIRSVSRFVSTESTLLLAKDSSVGWPDPRDLEVLRNFFSRYFQPIELGKRAYISRLRSKRSPFFEEDLIQELVIDGWDIVYLENMTLLEQISFISSCETICGVGGAGLSSAVWMAPESKVIELSPNWFVPCFSRLATLLHLKYSTIFFESTNLTHMEVLREIQRYSQE